MKLKEKDYTHRNLINRFPGMVKDAIGIREYRGGELLLIMPDGTEWLYSDLHSNVRQVPTDLHNLSEEECLSEFGRRLYDIMCREGISQLELSERTGITQPLISNYMSGKTCPSFYKVDKIARALGCSVDDFRYDDRD